MPGAWSPYGPGYAPGYPPPPPPGGGRQVVAIVLVCLVGGFLGIAMLAAILVPNFLRARGQGMTTACKSNLKNIGTGLEMYSTDNEGQYPTTLEKLSPAYLKRLPTCPAAGRETYSSGYRQFHQDAPPISVDRDGKAVDAYTVVCVGTNHQAVGQGTNFPQYTSEQGLISQ